MTEADTCRKFVVPLLQKAGWDNDPHSIAEQRYFTAGRIVPQGQTARRRPGKRADYLLRYTRDLPLAVVEAKADYKHPADGLQQAKEYATILPSSASRSPTPPTVPPSLSSVSSPVAKASSPTSQPRQTCGPVAAGASSSATLPRPTAFLPPLTSPLARSRTTILKVPPISRPGTVGEIATTFGGPDQLRGAVHQLQTLLYLE
jgi:hypothetical protein